MRFVRGAKKAVVYPQQETNDNQSISGACISISNTIDTDVVCGYQRDIPSCTNSSPWMPQSCRGHLMRISPLLRELLFLMDKRVWEDGSCKGHSIEVVCGGRLWGKHGVVCRWLGERWVICKVGHNCGVVCRLGCKCGV